tara:strand:- start:1136 stop:3802 length:2667 start_codon:yes stop_codon:yes gene_type:complete
MDSKEYNEIFLRLRTLSNLYKSNVPEDELMIVESFFTLLRKEGLLIESESNLSAINYKLRIQKCVDQSDNNQIKELYYNHIKSICDSVRKTYLGPLYNSYLNISDYFIKNYSREFFDQQLNNFFNSKRSLGSDALQPKELTAILNSFRPQNKEAYSYFNPFAGLASLTTNIQNDTNYLGEELNTSIWVLAKLRLLIYDKPDNFKLVNRDSILALENDEKFDFICFNPPFNLKLRDSRYNSIIELNEFGSKINANALIFSSLLEKLNPDGKMVFVVPDGFLTSSNQKEKAFRKHLIENSLIDMVISLPQRIYNFTGIKSSIIVMSKNTNKGNRVKFIDISECVDSTAKRINKIDLISALQVINSENTTLSQWIELEKIKKSDYHLAVGRYMLDDFDGRFLADFTTIQPGINLKTKSLKVVGGGLGSVTFALEDTGKINSKRKVFSVFSNVAKYLKINKGKVVKIRDLKNDRFDYKLDSEQLEVVELIKQYKMISESCLLLSNIGGNIKPTYFEYKNEPIFINHNITALKVDKNVSTIDYLINELHLDYVLEQVNAFSKGAAISTISRKDILNIKIGLPSLQEQEAKVQGAKSAFLQSIGRELRLKEELLGFKQQSDRNFKSVLHTMRQYLNALKTNVGGTSIFIEKYGSQGINLDTVYSKNLNQTFGEHLASLEGTISSMTKLLDSYENKDTKTKSEVLRLENIVQEAQNRFKNPDIFRFEKVYIDHDAFASELGYLDQFVDINKEDFFKVFSNIVFNAVDHGFIDEKKRNNYYTIRTAILNGTEKNEFILEISNNGESMPENFSYNDLVTRGEKSTSGLGSGTGGSDIKNILVKYNAYFELFSDENDGFPVKYILHFPQKTIIDQMEQNGYPLGSSTSINYKQSNNDE